MQCMCTVMLLAYLICHCPHYCTGQELAKTELELSDPGNRLPLLGAVLNESLRYKPVGPVVIRQATADVQLSLAQHEPAATASADHQVQHHGTTTASSEPAAPGKPQATYSPASAQVAAPQKQRQVQQQGPSSLTIRKGEKVIIHLAGMHRDAAVFAVPHAFDVANFLDPATGQVVARSRHLFQPFGSGIKGCVGKQLAWAEMVPIMRCWVDTFASAGQVQQAAPSSSGGKHSSSGSSLLSALATKWEVAQQPTEEVLLALELRQGSSWLQEGGWAVPDAGQVRA